MKTVALQKTGTRLANQPLAKSAGNFRLPRCHPLASPLFLSLSFSRAVYRGGVPLFPVFAKDERRKKEMGR